MVFLTAAQTQAVIKSSGDAEAPQSALGQVACVSDPQRPYLRNGCNKDTPLPRGGPCTKGRGCPVAGRGVSSKPLALKAAVRLVGEAAVPKRAIRVRGHGVRDAGTPS